MDDIFFVLFFILQSIYYMISRYEFNLYFIQINLIKLLAGLEKASLQKHVHIHNHAWFHQFKIQ